MSENTLNNERDNDEVSLSQERGSTNSVSQRSGSQISLSGNNSFFFPDSDNEIKDSDLVVLSESFESIMNDIKAKNNQKKREIKFYETRIQRESEFNEFVNRRSKIYDNFKGNQSKVPLPTCNPQRLKTDYFPPLAEYDYNYLLTRRHQIQTLIGHFSHYIRDEKIVSKQLLATEIRTKQSIVG